MSYCCCFHFDKMRKSLFYHRNKNKSLNTILLYYNKFIKFNNNIVQFLLAVFQFFQHFDYLIHHRSNFHQSASYQLQQHLRCHVRYIRVRSKQSLHFVQCSVNFFFFYLYCYRQSSHSTFQRWQFYTKLRHFYKIVNATCVFILISPRKLTNHCESFSISKNFSLPLPLPLPLSLPLPYLL